MLSVKLSNIIGFTLFVIFTLFVFRIREYGSDQVDFQIIFRVLGWVSACFISVLYFRRFRFSVNSRLEAAFIAFSFFSLLMIPFSLIPLRSGIVLLSYFSFYIYFKCVLSRFGLEYLLKCLVISFSVVLFFSYFYYFFMPDLGRHIYWLNDELYQSPRMSGVFSTSNAMGGFSAVYCLLLLYCYSNNVVSKRAFIFLFILSFFSILMSDSKTAIASFIFSAFFLYKRNSFINYLIILSSILSLFVISAAIYDFHGFLTLLSRHGDPEEILTFTGRTLIWPAVLDMALLEPFTGYGLGVTSIAIPTLVDAIGYTPAHAHNLILQAFFSLGLIGLCIICYITFFNFVSPSTNKLGNAFAVYIVITSLFEASFLAGVADFSIIPLVFNVITHRNKAAKDFD